MIAIRPAVEADFVALAGEPPPVRVRAWTGADGDMVLGVGGLAFVEGAVVGFAELSPEARAHPVALHRTALRFLARARAMGIRRIVAHAADDVAAAERWLLRLGFEPVEVDGKRVFQWHP